MEHVAAEPKKLKTDIASKSDPEEAAARREVLPTLMAELVALLDEMINSFKSELPEGESHEHLEVLRVMLRSQTQAYLGYIIERDRPLTPQMSEMYAGAVGPSQVVSTTLRALIEGGSLSVSQAARLAGYVSDRRTMVIFGDRATGKSTLLNALLELASVDERFVSIEQVDHLPALQNRSFCVRLSVDEETELESLFAKALKMQPNRIVIGEVHGDEILHFMRALQTHPAVGGFCTLRADSVHGAVAKLTGQMEAHVSPDEARQLVGDTHPVLVHMRSDEKGIPRLGALWSVAGLDAAGEIRLSEETTV
jgi:hypothetical protein